MATARGLLETIRGGLGERIALMAPSRRLRMRLAERELKRHANGGPLRILDAGCGDGLLTLTMAKRHPRWHFTGLDISEELLAGARERAANRGIGNVEFVQADLTKALPVSGFDAVVALECLSEIPDDRGAMAALAGALGTAALLLVQAPERDWKPVLPGSSGTWRHEVRHGYSAAELEQALSDAGLGEIETRPTYRSVAAAAQEVRDRVKDRGVFLRAALFPAMAAAVRLELWGLTFGRPNAVFALARPDGHAHP